MVFQSKHNNAIEAKIHQLADVPADEVAFLLDTYANSDTNELVDRTLRRFFTAVKIAHSEQLAEFRKNKHEVARYKDRMIQQQWDARRDAIHSLQNSLHVMIVERAESLRKELTQLLDQLREGIVYNDFFESNLANHPRIALLEVLKTHCGVTVNEKQRWFASNLISLTATKREFTALHRSIEKLSVEILIQAVQQNDCLKNALIAKTEQSIKEVKQRF